MTYRHILMVIRTGFECWVLMGLEPIRDNGGKISIKYSIIIMREQNSRFLTVTNKMQNDKMVI